MSTVGRRRRSIATAEKGGVTDSELPHFSHDAVVSPPRNNGSGDNASTFLTDPYQQQQQHGRGRSTPRRRIRRKVSRNVQVSPFQLVGIVALAFLSGLVLSLMVVSHQRSDQTVAQTTKPGLQEPAQVTLAPTLNRTLAVAETVKKRSSSHQQEDGLQIAWLMSYPNSGTSYTSRLIRDVSQTFTASNYADETPAGMQGQVEAVFADQRSGPFWTIPEATPDYGKPTNFVLTKTHCGIRCNHCPPEEYAESTYSFRRRCLVTKWVEKAKTTHAKSHNKYGSYPIDSVTKAVHLVRNPFDNAVSRFHLARESPLASAYPLSRDGYLQYCLDVDFAFADNEKKYSHFKTNPLLSALWMVPCHAEFIKYVEWHNLAGFLTSDLQLDTLVLHYESFAATNATTTTLDQLLAFLHLERKAEPYPFIFKSYDSYYTPAEKKAVKQAYEFMASRQTWNLVQDYFS